MGDNSNNKPINQYPYTGNNSNCIEPLERPVLPWLRESRPSVVSSKTCSSVDASSLHFVKRNQPDPNIKRKQRWTKHKWWLLFSNTMVTKKKQMLFDRHFLSNNSK